MKTLHHLTTAVLLTLALAPVLPLQAQESAAKAKVIASITLDRNVPLGKMVETLRKESGQNIVMAPGLDLLPAPDVVLSNTTLQGVLHIVDSLMPEIEVVTVGSDPAMQVFSIQATGPGSIQQADRAVTRIFKASNRALKTEEFHDLGMRISQVMNLALKGAAAQPEIECHPPTGIFIVTGLESQVRVVADVITALGGEAVQTEAPVSRVAVPEAPRATAFTELKGQTLVTLQYIDVEQAVKSLQAALGEKADGALLRMDARTNSVVLNGASSAAPRMKVLLEQLDQRPQTYLIQAVVKKGLGESAKILSRPTLLTLAGKTASIALGDGKDQERLEVELTVKPGPMGEGLIAKTAQDLDLARQALQQAESAAQQAAQRVMDALHPQAGHSTSAAAGSLAAAPRAASACRTSCIECHASAPATLKK